MSSKPKINCYICTQISKNIPNKYNNGRKYL